MPTPVTSMVWRITFRRISLTDQRTFNVDLANTTPKAVVDALARSIVELNSGYEHVATTLAVVLP